MAAITAMGKRKRNEDEVNASDLLEAQRKRVDKLLQRRIATISHHLEVAKKTDNSEAAAIKVPSAKGSNMEFDTYEARPSTLVAVSSKRSTSPSKRSSPIPRFRTQSRPS